MLVLLWREVQAGHPMLGITCGCGEKRNSKVRWSAFHIVVGVSVYIVPVQARGAPGRIHYKLIRRVPAQHGMCGNPPYPQGSRNVVVYPHTAFPGNCCDGKSPSTSITINIEAVTKR